MPEYRNDLAACPFCGHQPCYQFAPNPNGPKYPGHHEIWCENPDCLVAAEVSEVDKATAERYWNTRTAPQLKPD